jgi:predicted nucleic acid-binding protein
LEARPTGDEEAGERRVRGGVTFDTGAFISVERRRDRARKVFERLREQDIVITAPLPVIGEWWRGRTDWRDRILASVRVEPLTLSTVKLAGEALASVPAARKGRGPSIVDAIVMASAASRGDVVYTGDVDDLERLQPFFPEVRLLSL